jgi:arylsulfatase A-like enzyme
VCYYEEMTRQLAFLVGLALVGALTVSLLLVRHPRGPQRRGAILISIDTLRPDHLGCYGYHHDTSPAIDAFAADAVLFTQAIAHAPSTLPSHASILSSLLPSHHGAFFSSRTPLSDEILTVTEVFRNAGFRTASFNGGGQIDASFGLAQGFGYYNSIAVILTSDHGEKFGEHGMVGWHSHTLYDELLRVPLIGRLPRPRQTNLKVRTQVQLLDVAPTLLSAGDIPIPPVFRGSKLQLVIQNRRSAAPPPVVSVRDQKSPKHLHASLRSRKWKLIQNRPYNLEADPGEQRDLARQEHELASQMRALLEARLASDASIAPTPPNLEVGGQLEQQLRALGYVD